MFFRSRRLDPDSCIGSPLPARYRLLPLLVALLALSTGIPTAHAGALHEELELFFFTARAGAPDGPWAEVREELVEDADRPWRWGEPGTRYVTTVDADGRKSCHPEDDPDQVDYLKEGAPDAYARALAHRTLPDTERSARWAFEARVQLLRLTATRGFHGPEGKEFSGSNQCILDLAVSVPVWIATAELLEGSGVWNARERELLARWLAEQVYPRVAWASRVRRNNWGAAGSLSARMIARYVEPSPVLLAERAPQPRLLSAPAAVAEHDRMQRRRMRTGWRGDSRCPIAGIQPHGGIPDELRRGSGGCRATDLASDRDAGHGYQTMQVELLTMHAEVLRREGDPSLYELWTDAREPALLQAILFVIDNPTSGGRSWDWGVRTGALRVAYRYYRDPRLAEQLEANAHRGFRGGRSFPYTQVHPLPGP